MNIKTRFRHWVAPSLGSWVPLFGALPEKIRPLDPELQSLAPWAKWCNMIKHAFPNKLLKLGHGTQAHQFARGQSCMTMAKEVEGRPALHPLISELVYSEDEIRSRVKELGR